MILLFSEPFGEHFFYLRPKIEDRPGLHLRDIFSESYFRLWTPLTLSFWERNLILTQRLNEVTSSIHLLPEMGNYLPLPPTQTSEPPGWKPCEMCQNLLWSTDLTGGRLCLKCLDFIQQQMEIPTVGPYFSRRGNIWYKSDPTSDLYRCRGCGKERPRVKMFSRINNLGYNEMTAICKKCGKKRGLELVEIYKLGRDGIIKEVLIRYGIPEEIIEMVQEYSKGGRVSKLVLRVRK